MNSEYTPRRAVLRSAGALGTVALAATAAGCAGVANDLGKRRLSVARVRSSGDSGSNAVTLDAWVRNDWVTRVSATLVGEVVVDTGNTYRQRQSVAVAAGETARYTLKFDLDSRDSPASHGIRPSVQIE